MGILGANTGPLGSLRAIHFRGPHDSSVRANAFIAESLCDCMLCKFCVIATRIPLLRRDCGRCSVATTAASVAPGRVRMGILGANTGPLGSLRAIQFRGPARQFCAGECIHP